MSLTGALLAAQVLGGVAQAGIGISQASKLNRPEYEIPAEIEANMTRAQRMSYQGLPDEQKREFLTQIERQMTSSMIGLSDRKAGIGAITALNQQANDSTMKLLSADTAQRMSNINTLYDISNKYSEFSDRKFMMNEMQPFQENMASAQQLQAAGLQNIMSGISGFASLDTAQTTADSMTQNARIAANASVEVAKETSEASYNMSNAFANNAMTNANVTTGPNQSVEVLFQQLIDILGNSND